jgi:SAM-dependent methyltransferase
LKRELLRVLRCPECAGQLRLASGSAAELEIEAGSLECEACPHEYPIVGFIPRFVAAENYAKTFGFQWNEFRATQLDSHTGLPLSRERFEFSTGVPQAELSGMIVLDAGCGAGRFAEVALNGGAELVAVDYSSAVDACWKNLGPSPRLNVVQADIYRLPFEAGTFDLAYCLGVLQHTPDVARAFRALVEQVRPGGKLAVDVYPRLLLNLLWPKYWLRPFTKRMSARKLMPLVRWMVDTLLPVSLVVGRVPVVGRRLRYAIPVANHEPDFPLSPEQVREWALLNTYDMLAPVHDHPQSAKTLATWFLSAGLSEIEVFRRGHLIGRGVR